MNRRNSLLALFALGTSLAHGQHTGKVPRLCFLTFDPGTTLVSTRHTKFFDDLRGLGYVDGRTIHIDYMPADGQAAQFLALAAECLRRNADIIVVTTTPGAQAAKSATHTVPIVMLALGDPVASGLVESLARPGGNVTGMTFVAGPLAAKRLEMLMEVEPTISRVLVLTYASDPISAPQIESLQHAARSLGVTLLIRDIRAAADLQAAFNAGAKAGVQGLITGAESIFAIAHAQVIELAAAHRLPAVYANPQYVPAGGLMAYVPNFPALYAAAASYVDKILKGARPSDLPVMQPTKFDLAINLRTAKALGIKIPQGLRFRADTVIE